MGTKIESILIIALAWLIALSILYMVIVKISICLHR